MTHTYRLVRVGQGAKTHVDIAAAMASCSATPSIRHVLNVCDTALEPTAPTYPDRLTEDHLRGASVALSA
jgi:hypothetical protein